MSQTPIALVTGGTSGVGLSMVRHLVSSGFFVYFVGTNTERGQALQTELNSVQSSSEFIALDLSKTVDVHDFAEDFDTRVPQLNVLANVAGVALPTRQENNAGLESTLAIGHFAPFVLTAGLLPALARAANGRIINVSGSARGIQTPSLSWDDLNLQRRYSGVRAAVAAVHSKTVMTQILAQKLTPLSVDVNAFHPGLVRSSLGRHFPWFLRLPFNAVQPLLSPTTRSGCYLCTCPAGPTGQLFVGERGRPLTFEPEYRDKVWNWTLQTTQRALGSAWTLPDALAATAPHQ